jgi:RNA polymerase sigma-70 factor, ECF subfamily
MGCDRGKIMHTLIERPLVISRAGKLGSGQATPDEALLSAIANGDQRAMRVLYARHHVRVYRFILRLTQDRSLVEDIVSDVFIDVWCQAGSFKGKSQASTWLLAIAHYKALSALRAHSDAQLDDNAAASVVDPADDAETMMSKRDRSITIQKCLAQLSAVHREVLDLVYYHERSVDEVAQIVGVPVSTVKTRMFYARKRMENLLEAAGLDRH